MDIAFNTGAKATVGAAVLLSEINYALYSMLLSA